MNERDEIRDLKAEVEMLRLDVCMLQEQISILLALIAKHESKGNKIISERIRNEAETSFRTNFIIVMDELEKKHPETPKYIRRDSIDYYISLLRRND